MFFMLSVSFGQEQHNFIGFGGELLPDEVGPYYFIAEGNSADAFARVDLLAQTLGVAFSYDSVTNSFSFTNGNRTVSLTATSDVQAGLDERTGKLSVDGELRESPQIIFSGGQGYVAINPLVTALGGDAGWDGEAQIVLVDFVPGRVEDSVASASPSVTSNAAPSTVVEPAEEVVSLEKPRLGFYEDRTRLALDLPEDTPYSVLVNESTFVVALPGMQAETFTEEEEGPHLSSLGYSSVDGTLALVAETRYPLDPDGQGYTVGILPATNERPHEVLYVDFGPSLQGPSAETLQTNAQIAEAQPAAQEVRTPTGMKHTVVIDPGHGGRDPGAQGYASEEEVVLAIGLKVRDLLEQRGIEVILTRDGDYSLTDEKRTDLAARADLATSDKHNLFVSIHANAVDDPRAQGVETWVFGEPLDDSLVGLAVEENGGGALGAELTEAAQDAAGIEGELFREEQLNYSWTLANMVQQRMVTATGAIDRGVQKNVFYVVRNTRTPAILVETGFVSNPEEGSKLATDAYQTTLAEAIAEGIINFFEQGGVFAQQQ